MAALYFDCVNDNGGINGRPIEYIATRTSSPDPALLAVAGDQARRAGQGARHRRQHRASSSAASTASTTPSNGFHPIIAGVAPGCFTSPQWSAVNMGPYYSNLGGAQAAVRAGAKGTLVVVSPNQPGMDFNNTRRDRLRQGPGARGQAVPRGRPDRRPGRARPAARPGLLARAAASCSTSPARRSFRCCRPSTQQGLIDTVIWASSTPPNDPSRRRRR